MTCSTYAGADLDPCKDDPKLKVAGAICERPSEAILVNLMAGAYGPMSADAGGGG